MTLMERRRALLSKAEEPNPKYTSSKGHTYRKYMTMNLNNQLIADVLDRYGLMPEMEELTIQGSLITSAGSIVNGKLDWSSYTPKLKKLWIIPAKVASDNSFKCSHYNFTGLYNLQLLQLGSLANDGAYFTSGGYFRDDNGTKTVGTSAGLHLIVYRTAYDEKGGFANGTKASSTVVTCYNKDTGEVMTA